MTCWVHLILGSVVPMWIVFIFSCCLDIFFILHMLFLCRVYQSAFLMKKLCYNLKVLVADNKSAFSLAPGSVMFTRAPLGFQLLAWFWTLAGSLLRFRLHGPCLLVGLSPPENGRSSGGQPLYTSTCYLCFIAFTNAPWTKVSPLAKSKVKGWGGIFCTLLGYDRDKRVTNRDQ